MSWLAIFRPNKKPERDSWWVVKLSNGGYAMILSETRPDSFDVDVSYEIEYDDGRIETVSAHTVVYGPCGCQDAEEYLDDMLWIASNRDS